METRSINLGYIVVRRTNHHEITDTEICMYVCMYVGLHTYVGLCRLCICMCVCMCVHRRIQDCVRGGQGPLGPPGGAKALLAPLDPRLTIWGSNILWGGGAKRALWPAWTRPPPWIRAWCMYVGLGLCV